jgi:3-oxoadipate enol-lactonase
MSAVAVGFDTRGEADAPPLVLSGSLGTTRAMWEPAFDALASRFRVLRYDHRGHGESPAPPGPYRLADLGADLLALLDRLGVERAHVCGLSLGGLVGLWLAAAHPERVDRLVVCCTAPAFPPPEQWHERAATVRARGTAVLADALVQRWFTAGFPERHPEVVDRVRAMLADVSDEGYAGCCEALAEADLTDRLADVGAPTLAVAGAQDPVTPPAALQRIADGVGDGRLAVIPEAAHLASVEQPDRTAELITDHLAATGAR